jgi:hypothetical protein
MGARSPSKPRAEEKVVQGKKPAPRSLHCKLDTLLEGKKVTRTGEAVLTADELRFRTDRHGRDGADFHLHLAFAELARIEVDASGAILSLTTQEGDVHRLHVGKYAAEWKELLGKREGTLDLLGVGPGSRLVWVAVPDEAELVSELEQHGPAPQDERAVDLDLVFVGVEHPADLERVAALARRIRRPGGAIWLVYPERKRDLSPRDLATFARTLRLVDADNVALSRKYGALKLRAL